MCGSALLEGCDALTVANSPEARQSGGLANPVAEASHGCYVRWEMLTARQSAFVREFAIDMNGTQAAIRAGFSPRSAKVTASRLMVHPEVKVAIAQVMAERAADADVKATDVVARLKRIAMTEPGETWKGPEVMKAIELLARYLQMFGTEAVVLSKVTLEQLVPRRKPQPPGEAPKAPPVPSPASPAAAPSTPPPAAAPPAPPPTPTQPPAQAAPAPAPEVGNKPCVHVFIPPHNACRCGAWRPSTFSENRQPRLADDGAFDPWRHLRRGKPSA